MELLTFEQLNAKLGGSEQASDWSNHPNGGGWLHKSAEVDASAYVGPCAIVWGKVSDNARVYGNARVSGDAWVSGNAWVYGNAWVSGNAQVSDNARVYGNAWVYGDAQVSGNARVYGNARVSGNAQVSGDAWVYGNAWTISPLFIIGSRHSLTNAKHGHVQIGCKLGTFAWWLSPEGEAFGRDNGFDDAAVAEYRAYVELFAKVGK